MRIRDIAVRLLLIILCYLYFPFRGRSKKDIDTHSVRNILILNLSQLGDMVSATPLFHHVKERYPDARLYVAGKSVNKELLEYNEDVDEYIVFDEHKLLSFFTFLRREHIDVAVLIQTHFGALATLYLSGIKHIIAPTVTEGYSPFETKSYRLIRWLATVMPKRVGKNALGEHLRMLKPLGITGVTEEGAQRRLGFSKGAAERMRSFLRQHDISPEQDFIVAIAPSSGNKVKNWPADRFARVAEYVREHHQAKVLIIGGPGDSQEVSDMLSALPSRTNVVNTLGMFSVDELKALLSLVHMFISADCGPLYVAIAFGVPTIDILGPAPEWAVPRSEVNRTISNRGGALPAIHPLNNRDIDFKEARRQAEAVTVEMIVREVDDLCRVIETKKNGKRVIS